jgi:hypothetical protein
MALLENAPDVSDVVGHGVQADPTLTYIDHRVCRDVMPLNN